MNSDLKVKSLKKSFNAHFLPDRAGAYSIKNFFTAKQITAPLNVYCKLDADETISGIIEGEFQQNDRVICRLGVESNPINYLDVLQLDYKLEKSLDVYIGYLRRKTEEGGESRVVYTIRGVGYTVKA